MNEPSYHVVGADYWAERLLAKVCDTMDFLGDADALDPAKSAELRTEIEYSAKKLCAQMNLLTEALDAAWIRSAECKRLTREASLTRRQRPLKDGVRRRSRKRGVAPPG